jgi:hypothetical protein
MLPSYGNSDGRLQTVRRGIVKINGVEDEHVKSMNRSRIAKNFKTVLYNGGTLGGALAGEQYKCYESEPVGVFRSRAGIADPQRFPSGKPGNRSVRGQEIRVPVVYNCNGLKADQAWEIDQQVQILGFSDQTGRHSGKNHLNIIVGGLITVVNSGPQTIEAGDLVMARAPTAAELKSIKCRAGDIANKNGRVPFILVPFDPSNYDMMNRVRFKQSVDEWTSARFDKAAFLKARATAPYSDLLYDMAVWDVVTNVTALAPFARGGDNVAQFTAVGNAIVGKKLDGTDLDKDVVNAGFSLLMANARLMADLSSRCVGRAVLSAEPGKDFDIFIGRFMR